MAIVPDISRLFLGTNALTAQTLYLNLFSDDETIGAATVAGSFTVVTGGGYVQCTLAGTGWTGGNSGGTCSTTYATQAFPFTGSVGNVYGYAITTATGITGNLVGAEKFATAQMVSASGDQINIVPTLKLV